MLKYSGNSNNGKAKIKMSESVGVEIERKFIVEKPDPEVLEGIEGYTRSEILQIYLNSKSGETKRIRRRQYPDRTLFYETRKIRIDPMSSTEIEREITEADFEERSKDIKTGTSPVKKIRYTFEYSGHTFELDVYPEWKKSSIMEVELGSREEKVIFPPFIKIVKEVTGNKNYSNASMSRRFPRES